MKSLLLGFACFLFFGLAPAAKTAPAGTNVSENRLTVELRDGSRVVGTAAEKDFRFRSKLLGEIKMAVENIRSVECVSSNSAKLITANGDSLTVAFEDSKFSLKTGFGKIEVAADSIRKISVSGSSVVGTRQPGLVALWPGENNGKDSVGGNDAELTDITFADGKVGQAFSLEGENAMVKIPGNSSLNVGAGNGLTLCAWIKPSDISKNNPIFEWVQEGFTGGTQFYIYPPHGGAGTLYFMLADIEGNPHYFSAARSVVPNVFQYVAATYDRETGMGALYCNGVMVAQQNLGSFTPQTSCNLYLGKRPLIGGETWSFTGCIDEAAIYNRALSAAEIRQICIEANHGELPPPPVSFQSRPPFSPRNY